MKPFKSKWVWQASLLLAVAILGLVGFLVRPVSFATAADDTPTSNFRYQSQPAAPEPHTDPDVLDRTSINDRIGDLRGNLAQRDSQAAQDEYEPRDHPVFPESPDSVTASDTATATDTEYATDFAPPTMPAEQSTCPSTGDADCHCDHKQTAAEASEHPDHHFRPRASHEGDTWTPAATTDNFTDTPVTADQPAAVDAPTRTPFDQPTTPRGIPSPSHATPPITVSADYPAAPSSSVHLATRWRLPESASLGEEVVCQLIVENQAATPAHGVQVRATLDPHAEIVSTEPPAIPPSNAAANDFIWNLGTLAPSATQTIILHVVPTAPQPLRPRAVVTSMQAAQADITIVEPRVDVVIHGPNQSTVGRPTTLELEVTNRGTGNAPNVVVDVQLPPALAQTTTGRDRYRIGMLPSGKSRVIHLNVHGTDFGEHHVSAQATVAGHAASSTDHVVHVVRPQLQVAIEGPRLRYIDRDATYVASIHNPGPAPVENVQLLGAVPAGFRYVESDGGGVFDNQTHQVAWFVGHLEPEQTTQVQLKLVPLESGAHEILAEVAADGDVHVTASASTVVEGVAAVVLDVTCEDDPIEVGATTIYTLRVANRGSRTASAVQVAALLPEEVELLATDAPRDASSTNEQVVFQPLLQLEPGASESYRIRVKCAAAGNARLRAFFRTAEDSVPVAEEFTTRIYED